MKPPLQKPRVATRFKCFLKNNRGHKHIKTMTIGIKNTNTFEERNKVKIIQWRIINKVIEQDYFNKSYIFS